MEKRSPIRQVPAMLLSFIITAGSAQEPVTVESLKAPSMPAGYIIGTQINEITRPKSLKALETALMGNFTNDDRSGLVVPNNYALEVQPWMLGNLKNFNYASYINDGRDMGESLWRNLALSVASTKEFRIKDSVATDALGAGLRLVFREGKLSTKLKQRFTTALVDNDRHLVVKSIVVQAIGEGLINDANATMAQLRGKADEDLDTKLSADNSIDAATRTHLKKNAKDVFDALPAGTKTKDLADVFEDKYDELHLNDALKKFRIAIDDVGTERYGLRVELDLATSLHFPTNDMELMYRGRTGGWLNIGWRPEVKEKDGDSKASASEFILLLRALSHNNDFYDRFQPLDSTFQRGSNFDIGLKYVLNRHRWSVELEYISRLNRVREVRLIDEVEYSRNVDNPSSKLQMNFNYAVTPNLNLSYNFGKGFDDVFVTDDLISMLNLNLSFGGVDAREVLEASQ